MTPEEFVKQLYDNDYVESYGVLPPPIDAQKGLDILIKHFLGDDWYATGSIHTAQVNSEAICEILKRYPNRRIGIFQFIDKLKYR